MNKLKYLYKMNDYTNQVEIYSIVPKLYDVRSFREKTINGKSILCDAFLTENVNCVDKASEYRISEEKYNRDLSEDEVNNNYHKILKSNTNSNSLVSNYINYGVDSDSRLYHVVGKKNYGIIVPNSGYKSFSKYRRCIKNIIKIPDELYVLERILLGEYSRIEDYYLEILSPLFFVGKVGVINYRDIKKVIANGILDDTLENVDKKFSTSEKILQKLKK